jgi:DNA repair exonuclease SbcCD ATPase subunit
MYIQLEYLKFKNVLSYGAKEIMHTFEPGLTMISGRNGVGKSTLQEVISYNWFGKPYRKIKLEALINRENKKGLETETGILIDNKDRYRIIRNMKPNLLKIIKNDVPFELLSSKALDQEDIVKILGIDYKMFKQIVSLAVTYNKPFLTLDAADKREVVESIFNIKIIGLMLDTLKKKISTEKVKYTVNKKTVEMLEGSINIMRKNIIEVKKSISEFETLKQKDINTAVQNIENIKNEISKTENTIAISDTTLHTFKQKEISFNSLLTEKEKLFSSISEDVSNPAINSLLEELTEINNRINILLSCVENLEKLTVNYHEDSVYTVLLAEQTELLQRETKIKNDLLTCENTNIDYTADNEYQELSKKETEKINDLSIANEQLKNILSGSVSNDLLNTLNLNKDDMLRFIHSCKITVDIESEYIDYLKNNTICKKCKSEITDDFRKEEIIKSQKVIDQNNIEIINFNKEIELIKNKIISINELMTSITDIKTQITNIKNSKNTRQIIIDNEKQKKITSIKNDLTSVASNITNSRTAIKNREKTLTDEHNKKISDLKSEHEKLLLSKSIKQSTIDTIKKEKIKIAEQEILTIKSDIEKNKLQITTEESNNNRYKLTLATLIEDIKKNETYKKEIEDRKSSFNLPEIEKEFNAKIEDFKSAYAENGMMANNLKIYDITATMLSEEGIKSFFFKRLTPILNAKINEYLDKFDIPVRCKFNEQMEEQIYNVGNESELVSYYSYSEGEKKSIDTAILMSFIDITKVICNWRCNILMVDELIDGQVDFPRLEKMFDCLREFSVSGMIPSIYIISHRQVDEIQSFFKRIISINKVNGFSELTVKKM